jgi:DNA-binding MarR family transcriptional regulator
MTGFNEVIHAPYRLRICAVLAVTTAVEFGVLRDTIEVSDSALSKHLSTLQGAGYLTTHRQVHNTRSRLWVSLTDTGRQAYDEHVRALREIINTTGHPAG